MVLFDKFVDKQPKCRGSPKKIDNIKWKTRSRSFEDLQCKYSLRHHLGAKSGTFLIDVIVLSFTNASALQ